jgi:ferredoxin
MSKKDGKATLIKGIKKKEVIVLDIPDVLLDKSKEIALACPVRIIKVS